MNLVGRFIASILEKPLKGYEPATTTDEGLLASTLQPGDVLLVEGNNRVSSVIKYLTQSTWSHSAIYVGDCLGQRTASGEPHVLIEAEMTEGVVTSPLSKYRGCHVRICRPVALAEDDRARVIAFLKARVGHAYDIKNVLDMARFLIPLPIPARYRRRMLAFGSGDPSRAICSTLIAEAFQSVHYPILARVESTKTRKGRRSRYARREILHIRHHSLYAPRDFDISPYFSVVKPTIEAGFDYKALRWTEKFAVVPAKAHEEKAQDEKRHPGWSNHLPEFATAAPSTD